MTIKKVFVMGAGLMGSGIAQVSAQAGYSVIMCDISREALDKATGNIRWSLEKFSEKGIIREPVDKVLDRITPTMEAEDASEADLAIEAVFENIDLKKEVFQKLDRILPEHAVLASNTSAIPITTLASVTNRRDRVLGLHFFSPVPMMQAVEVIRAMTTSDETFETARKFVISLGKEPILVHRDIPGFLINRINFCASLEAMRLVEAGIASVEDIDKGLRLASGRRMGIFETGDMVGLDVTYGALMAMYEETKDPRWYPPAILRRKIQLGHLGRKTGRGWYVYDAQGNRIGPSE
ncbi:3-hydroxyacyl-CoA dehydrogenase family protein [Thermodesulforhabdus norvegica]|uniref:3-hydroxyacyl-CoA dehydrogenase n=1 Tax=Thermodesulforhabdus norvegica TaxID=39841 RepID=A0A1I4WA01_9BACT|nr:3-hydroxyacyl-CoA dehydrogenase family protein [Thermodesulforhabdus norvegica]SFN10203.1 3-hydroxyacyl-CoA dehydrogenase [Thermodesulforhabdus norvegica]